MFHLWSRPKGGQNYKCDKNTSSHGELSIKIKKKCILKNTSWYFYFASCGFFTSAAAKKLILEFLVTTNYFIILRKCKIFLAVFMEKLKKTHCLNCARRGKDSHFIKIKGYTGIAYKTLDRLFCFLLFYCGTVCGSNTCERAFTKFGKMQRNKTLLFVSNGKISNLNNHWGLM